MAEMNATEAGVIKVYFPLKGYGFITRPIGKDVFFYRDAVPDEATLAMGNPVSFVVQSTDRGPQATLIKRLG